MFSDLLQLSASANAVLLDIFPLLIIGLGIAYGIKQWRDHGKKDD